ncbi:hypothetical protein K450DRAFT_221436 [Umbelopsis ramanniana AG]|uniref:Uncharacterized protein n=1 Tax=Umbelopsis ramanniana AG TaxID=1314678 RepID=A0AAD5EHK9_UMBRA|nr:uncharacterized protein K450DRAFT_221436 [Umbelopsis ramanniana AG]KAI8583482.1 hypothetical protein K450DRAFT_221436 [Umbelopsis ramanniana AG]
MSFPHKRPKPRFSLFAADPLDPPAPKIRLADRIKASARTMPGIKVTSFILGLTGGILAAAMFKHSCSTSAKTLTADVTSKLDHMRRQLENGGGVPHSLQDEEFVRTSSQDFTRDLGLMATVKYHCQHGWNQGIEHVATVLNSFIER